MMKKKEYKSVKVYVVDWKKLKKWATDRQLTIPEMVNLIIKKI